MIEGQQWKKGTLIMSGKRAHKIKPGSLKFTAFVFDLTIES